jgi:hypothetical protein
LEPPALFGAYAKGGDNAELKGWRSAPCLISGSI